MPARRTPGRLATPALPPLPGDLAGLWRWERQDHLDETPEDPIAIARRYVRVMELEDEPMATKQKIQTDQPALPALPEDLAGWRWQVGQARATPTGSLEPYYHLVAVGSDWTTESYTKPEKAIAEARRWLLSQPKTKPSPELPTAPTGWRWMEDQTRQPSVYRLYRLCRSDDQMTNWYQDWNDALEDARDSDRGDAEALGWRFTEEPPGQWWAKRSAGGLREVGGSSLAWVVAEALRHSTTDVAAAAVVLHQQHAEASNAGGGTASPPFGHVTHRYEETDLGVDLHARLVAARWHWADAKYWRNGWHHHMWQGILPMLHGGYFLRSRIVAMLDQEAAATTPPATEVAELPPSGSPIEDDLRAHGWSWEAVESRGEPGYRFRNQYTHEVCWHPSLERRLEFDQHRPLLYDLLADGFVPGPDAVGVFRRPPSVHEHMRVAVEQIVRGRYQPRQTFDEGELQELADSIESHGILTRLKVFLNERAEYELIAGERRLRAAKLVGLPEVPVEVCEWTLAQIHEVSLIDNLQRKGLTPVEEGMGYERLVAELGVSEAELARRLGKNRAYIQQRRALASAAPELRAALADGTLTFSQARGICLGAGDSHKAQKAALKATLELIKNGRRVGEKETQQEATKALVKEVKKDLTALGWSVAERGSTPDQTAMMVWGGGERPCVWTGAELLAARKEGRRPTGTPPAPRTLTAADKATLAIQSYFHYDNFAPWLVFSGNNDTLILAPDGLPQLLDRIQADFAAMQARYAAAGWTLKKGSGTSYNFEARSSQGRSESAWMWKGVEELIAKIEAGQIGTKPEPRKEPQASEVNWTCDGCSTKHKGYDYTYANGKKFCKPCNVQRAAERATQLAATTKLLAREWDAYLNTAPLDLLRVLAASVVGAANWATTKEIATTLGLGDRADGSDTIGHVVTMEHEPLAAVLPQIVATWAAEAGIRFIEPTSDTPKEEQAAA